MPRRTCRGRAATHALGIDGTFGFRVAGVEMCDTGCTPSPLRIPHPASRIEGRGSTTKRADRTTAALIGVVLAGCLFAANVSGQTAPTSPAADGKAKGAEDRRAGNTVFKRRRAISDAALEPLMADAAKLAQYELEGIGPRLARPHHAVSAWGPAMVEDVLDRMLKPFTGNEYQDTFIRWHLMWVVKQSNPEQLRRVGKSLLKLVDRMPAPVAPSERPEHYHEPPDIASRYWKLFHSCSVIIGIPPFEKRYDPPESFQYMSPERLARAKVIFAEAQLLREQFETVTDHDAIAYNRRIRFVNWVIRQYRGELIYALIWTGDPQMARRIVAAIDRHGRLGSGIAVDLLDFLYQAAFEGALELYEPEFRRDLSRRLEKTARASEGWKMYGGQQRNFADCAFHIIYLLRDNLSLNTEEGAGASGLEAEGGSTP